MPLLQTADFGSENDGNTHKEYRTYCYQNGEYPTQCSLEETIQAYAKFHDPFQHEDGQTFPREDAIA